MLSSYSEIVLFFESELIALSNQAIEDFPENQSIHHLTSSEIYLPASCEAPEDDCLERLHHSQPNLVVCSNFHLVCFCLHLV